MVGADRLVNLAKQKAAVLEFARARLRVTLTVQDLQKLKNVKIHHVQTLFLEENGSAAAKNL